MIKSSMDRIEEASNIIESFQNRREELKEEKKINDYSIKKYAQVYFDIFIEFVTSNKDLFKDDYWYITSFHKPVNVWVKPDHFNIVCVSGIDGGIIDFIVPFKMIEFPVEYA